MSAWLPWIVAGALLVVAIAAWGRELQHERAARRRGRRLTDLSAADLKSCTECRMLEVQLDVAETALVRHREMHQRMAGAARKRVEQERRASSKD